MSEALYCAQFVVLYRFLAAVWLMSRAYKLFSERLCNNAHAAWFSLVALCFSAGAVRARLLAVRHWIDRAFGGLLVGLGLLLAVARGSR